MKQSRPFGLKDKIGYLMGDLGNDFTFIFASSYVMVFYTKIMGVSASLVGTMFLLSRALDAFTDVGMGRIVDTSRTTRKGRIRPWILRMCGFVSVASFLMYQSFFVDASMTVKVAYMFITYLLWGSVFYTSINIPYGSMASVISSNPKDRSSLSVFRSLGAGVASVLVMAVAPRFVYYTDETGNQVVSASGFSKIAGIFAICAFLSYLACYAMTTERVDYVPKEKKKEGVLQSLTMVFGSRSMLGIILSALLMLLANVMAQGLNNYLFADYFKNTAALSVYSVMSLPVMFLLALVSTKLATKFGKRECGSVGLLLSGIVYLLTGFLRVQNVWVFVAFIFISMLGMNFFMMQSYALVTDVIDDLEVENGSREDGMVYGIYSFSRKIGQALAGGLSGWALTWIGYDELAIRQSQEVANGIYALSTIFPGIIYLLCAAALWFVYPLNKRRVEANVKELTRRHSTM